MLIALFYGKESYASDPSVCKMLSALKEHGHTFIEIQTGAVTVSGASFIISVGGDGSFLCAASIAARFGIPVVGVNLGRLGFLSENTPETLLKALVSGAYSIEQRSLLESVTPEGKFLSLNEVAVQRSGAAMLGVEVSVDGKPLPAYWGDGLLVATASGSTAYSLSVGGPIVLPSSQVLIITPIAPHNLNVRPLIIPSNSSIRLKFLSRDPSVRFSADTYSGSVDAASTINIRLAQFSLKRICPHGSNFIKALTDKLHWGDDIRNN